MGPGAIAGVRERIAKASSEEVRGRAGAFLRKFDATWPAALLQLDMAGRSAARPGMATPPRAMRKREFARANGGAAAALEIVLKPLHATWVMAST